MQDNRYDAIVVGAGFAGLACAGGVEQAVEEEEHAHAQADAADDALLPAAAEEARHRHGHA